MSEPKEAPAPAAVVVQITAAAAGWWFVKHGQQTPGATGTDTWEAERVAVFALVERTEGGDTWRAIFSLAVYDLEAADEVVASPTFGPPERYCYAETEDLAREYMGKHFVAYQLRCGCRAQLDPRTLYVHVEHLSTCSGSRRPAVIPQRGHSPFGRRVVTARDVRQEAVPLSRAMPTDSRLIEFYDAVSRSEPLPAVELQQVETIARDSPDPAARDAAVHLLTRLSGRRRSASAATTY